MMIMSIIVIMMIEMMIISIVNISITIRHLPEWERFLVTCWILVATVRRLPS